MYSSSNFCASYCVNLKTKKKSDWEVKALIYNVFGSSKTWTILMRSILYIQPFLQLDFWWLLTLWYVSFNLIWRFLCFLILTKQTPNFLSLTCHKLCSKWTSNFWSEDKIILLGPAFSGTHRASITEGLSVTTSLGIQQCIHLLLHFLLWIYYSFLVKETFQYPFKNTWKSYAHEVTLIFF